MITVDTVLQNNNYHLYELYIWITYKLTHSIRVCNIVNTADYINIMTSYLCHATIIYNTTYHCTIAKECTIHTFFNNKTHSQCIAPTQVTKIRESNAGKSAD